MFTNTTSSGSLHDLVVVVAFMGALFSGFAGMTIWARKGGKPGGGFLVGGLLGGPGRVHPRGGHAQAEGNRQRRAVCRAHPLPALRGADPSSGARMPVLPA
jgi:hypothetical protein